MFKHWLIGFGLLLPSIAMADDSHPPVAISIQDQGKFDVLFDRAKSTATGAAFGGLIGAGVESAVRSGKDEKRMEKIKPFLSIESCEEQLLSAFQKKLNDKGYEIIVGSSGQLDTLSIAVDIKECGFKVVDTQDLSMAAFITFETETDVESLRSLDNETFNFYGRDHYQFSDLLSMEKDLNKVHEKVFQKAGVRLANKIIYR